MQTYSQTTEKVRVTVCPTYLENQSSPEKNQFVWAYHVCIENLGNDKVCIRKRYWRITDSLGRIHEVWGDGVVGEEPELYPGDMYEYTSGTPLSTPSGIMAGHYLAEKQDGQQFQIHIPVFSLDSPHQIVSVN